MKKNSGKGKNGEKNHLFNKKLKTEKKIINLIKR